MLSTAEEYIVYYLDKPLTDSAALPSAVTRPFYNTQPNVPFDVAGLNIQYY